MFVISLTGEKIDKIESNLLLNNNNKNSQSIYCFYGETTNK